MTQKVWNGRLPTELNTSLTGPEDEDTGGLRPISIFTCTEANSNEGDVMADRKKQWMHKEWKPVETLSGVFDAQHELRSRAARSLQKHRKDLMRCCGFCISISPGDELRFILKDAHGHCTAQAEFKFKFNQSQSSSGSLGAFWLLMRWNAP